MIVNKYKYGGGGSGSGSTYTAGEYIQIAEDVISVTGITPDLYLTTADTQDFVTEADITAATSPIQTQLDDIERVTATALTELHNDILEISGSTPDLSNYYTKAETDAEITGATQGFITSAYTGFTKTEDFDDLVDMVETKEEVVASAITELHNEILDISGDTPDLSNYYTSAQTDEAISAATSGKADKQNVTARGSNSFYWPGWNAQGVITGETKYSAKAFTVNGSSNNNLIAINNNNLPSFYAPTSAGTAGQPLLSNGSGAPVWGGYKFLFMTQTEYDALVTKDSTTIYFITGD